MFNRISKGFNSEIGLFNLVDKIYPSEKNEDDYHKLTGVKRDNENGVSLSEPEQATEKYVKSLIEAISTFNELDKTTQKLTSVTSKGKSLPIRLTINEILPNDSTNHTKVSLIKKSDKKEFATTEVRKDGSVINDIKIETINNAKGFTFFISEKAPEGDGMINSEISLEEAKTKFTYDSNGNLLNGMIFVNRFRTSKAGKVIASFPTPVMWGSKNKKTVLLNKAGDAQDVKHTSSFVGNFDFPGYTNSNGELVKNSKELDSINASIDDERNSKNYELAEFMDVRKEKGNTSTIQHSMDEYESYLKEQDGYRNEIERDNPELSTAVPKPKSKISFEGLEDEVPLPLKLEVEEDYSSEIVTMEGLNGKKFTGTEAEVMKAIQAQYNEELAKKKSGKGKKEEAPKKKYKDLGSILANEVAVSNTRSGLDLPKVKDDINNSPVTDRDENNQDLKRFIPFSIVEKANKNDKKSGQTAKQISDRGGYSVLELDSLLPNWKELLKTEGTSKESEIKFIEDNVFAHGTDDGYRVFGKSNHSYNYAKDLRTQMTNDLELGERENITLGGSGTMIYSVAAKMYDTNRGAGEGFLAVSIGMKDGHSLSKEEIYKMLNAKLDQAIEQVTDGKHFTKFVSGQKANEVVFGKETAKPRVIENKTSKPKKEDDGIIKDAKIEAEAYLSEEVTEFSAEMIADIFSNVISSKGKDAAFIAITQELINNSKVSKIKITKASYEYLYTAIYLQQFPDPKDIDRLLKQCTI
jgi:hypothetical protein